MVNIYIMPDQLDMNKLLKENNLYIQLKEGNALKAYQDKFKGTCTNRQNAFTPNVLSFKTLLPN